MFPGNLRTLRVRPIVKSVTLLCRNVSGNSWKNSGMELLSGVAYACRLPKWPTLQRIPINHDVNKKKPYSTFKIDRIQNMWQRSRIGAKEQNSLRGYQPANSDVNTDSDEAISALDKVRRIEERRKIQNKMQALMDEQHMHDERIQEENDRVIRKEVLVEREPARKQTSQEYSPVRSREKCKPVPWVSATVLAATGRMQQHRYMQTPLKRNPIKVENSLRGYQPANSDVNTDSDEAISALDKVRRIEERRKIQNKMQALMDEQHMHDERIQEENDRVIRKEVLVEREPARKQTSQEYSPVRSRETCKPVPWVSATVLAATGRMQQHRYMQTPLKRNPIKVEAEVQQPRKSVPGNPANGTTSGEPNQTNYDMSSRVKWAKSVLELHKTRAKRMDDILFLEGYSNESA
ncbi:GD15526 [Drosophila simulans]|uniref:GD15526 n=1 Tax=Drosophila simulans TaxID=7240 RepID=B4R3A7_DROSI|nr:GD15526 [Drosophila simulans]